MIYAVVSLALVFLTFFVVGLWSIRKRKPRPPVYTFRIKGVASAGWLFQEQIQIYVQQSCKAETVEVLRDLQKVAEFDIPNRPHAMNVGQCLEINYFSVDALEHLIRRYNEDRHDEAQATTCNEFVDGMDGRC